MERNARPERAAYCTDSFLVAHLVVMRAQPFLATETTIKRRSLVSSRRPSLPLQPPGPGSDAFEHTVANAAGTIALRPHQPHPSSLDAAVPPVPARYDRAALVRYSLAAILLVATAIRLATINTQSAWLDEGYTMAVARHVPGYLLAFTAQHDTHPPLYYLALHLWLAVTGFGVVQARLLSLLCGVGSVAALYTLAHALFDRTTALCAALLLAVSPLAGWYSNEIRMYAMAGLLALLALTMLLRAAQQARRSLWIGYVLCAALAFYTDYSAAFILLGGAGYSLLAAIKAQAPPRRWLISHGALAALLLPALAMLSSQLGRNLRSIAWVPSPTPQAVGATLLDLISQHTGVPVVVSLIGLGLGLLGARALRADLRRPRLRASHLFVACIFLAPLVLSLLLSLSHSIFLTRTVMMALYGLLIFYARGIVVLLRRRVIGGLLVLAPLLLVNAASLNAAYATTINEDWRGAAQYLRQQALPGDALLFDESFLQLPFDLYWDRAGLHNAEHGYPNDDGLLAAHRGSLATGALVDQATAGAQTAWLIARDQDSRNAAAGVVGARLRRHFSLAGQRHFGGGLTVYRFTSLSVARLPSAAAWLDAAGIVLQRVGPHDLVVLHGPGATAFTREWNAYPRTHAQARLVRIDSGGASVLTAMVSQQTRTIWLATAVAGGGDPAGIGNDWLYHHGPQIAAFQTYGPLRLYEFAYTWNKR